MITRRHALVADVLAAVAAQAIVPNEASLYDQAIARAVGLARIPMRVPAAASAPAPPAEIAPPLPALPPAEVYRQHPRFRRRSCPPYSLGQRRPGCHPQSSLR